MPLCRDISQKAHTAISVVVLLLVAGLGERWAMNVGCWWAERRAEEISAVCI